ncbi:unnamed protein product [Didymodactylos carnosus]|uniref:Odorant receptor n=1 Tax=Didymodactylos carnosus TaxID=1234261 RepID=A0A814UVU8_9BILA|nr:unnamed protein product [Didymodactylos carnosus]CAF1298628.1 unnamed protein product [Didymodactylos carnosus]CAF3944065.1 unnamed protein product [Didymodactylos carnosus]CAF4104281.1 unnamed protein product [Didymodactylos carnosus]
MTDSSLTSNTVELQEYEHGRKSTCFHISKSHHTGHEPRSPFKVIPQDRRLRRSPSTGTHHSPLVIKLISLFEEFFLAEDYPDGVSEDYLEFQFWNTIQTGCIAITGALAFHMVFTGMGIGNPASSSLAATIIWLLKDGAGMLGKIFFTWIQSSHLDADCKRWHYYGDLLNDFSFLLDLISPYFGSYLLLITSTSNICRAIVGVIHGSTRAVIFQHHARNNNLADISAKCASLETIINVILLTLLDKTPVLLWSVFTTLTTIHIYANYRSKRALLFNIFNFNRFYLVCFNYFNTGTISTVETVNNQEPILYPLKKPYACRLGLSIKHIPSPTLQSANIQRYKQSDNERFLILFSQEQFYVLLKPEIDDDDLLRLHFYLMVVMYTMQNKNVLKISESTTNFENVFQQIRNELQNTSDHINFETCLDILQQSNDQYYQNFKRCCIEKGWNMKRCLFNLEIHRCK